MAKVDLVKVGKNLLKSFDSGEVSYFSRKAKGFSRFPFFFKKDFFH